MKELMLKEFETEIARACGDFKEHKGCPSHTECGSGYCAANDGDKCQSIPKVREWLKTPGVVGIVLFRNQDVCSSSFGASSCVVVGPGKTYKTVEECEGKWLNDLPSQRQYAECFVKAGGVA